MAHQFTDQNFNAEVLQNKGLVIVDLYADWCVSPETLIATPWGAEKASSIEKENFVTSYYGKKLTANQVTYSITSNRLGHCVEVKTENGRRIKVTDDHRFFTPRGWKRADTIKPGDRVAVLPLSDEVAPREKSKKGIIISREDILKVVGPNMQSEHHLLTLEMMQLLPLRFDHKKLPQIARLIGALFSDGTLYQSERTNYREIGFIIGQRQDIEDIIKDIVPISFSRLHIDERITDNELGGRKWRSHTFRIKSLSTALWLFFKALGVPEGSKVNSTYRVPQWIFHASNEVQRQFLAGYLGGDGPKIAARVILRPGRNRPYNNFHINDLEFYKRADLENNGLRFAKDLEKLFTTHEIKIRNIFTEQAPYIRKDGKRSVIIHIVFRGDMETVYALARIGYAYAHQKQVSAYHVGEFLRRKKRFPQRIELYTDWFSEATKGLRDGLVWDLIQKIKPIYLPAIQKITVKKSHNFIANGFISHNCGPCRMMAPVIEELAKQYESKAKIGKLDVDANPNTAGQFGISSIPTLIFFKDGKQIDQLVGFQSKENLEKKIKEHL